VSPGQQSWYAKLPHIFACIKQQDMKSELDEKAVMLLILSDMSLKFLHKNLVDHKKMLFVHCTKTWATYTSF
jgi:hypothetical protein